MLGIAAVVAVLAGLNAPGVRSASPAEGTTSTRSPARLQGEVRLLGAWSTSREEYRTNAIHAALLHTGKVLIVAGLGQQPEEVRPRGPSTPILWDPRTDTFKKIPTPNDLFCSGHTQLPNGRLLVAGGTARYEKLKGEVTQAGGGMRVKNENPDKADRPARRAPASAHPPAVEYVAGST